MGFIVIPISIYQDSGPHPLGVVAVYSVPRLGESIFYRGDWYEVIEVVHLLPDIIVKIAPRISSRRVWR